MADTDALTAEAPTQDELVELRQTCDRSLGGYLPQTPRATLEELLAVVDADVRRDHYGVGGPVTELEQEVAELLGKPAAMFVPSGTTAQLCAFAVWAGRTGNRTVAFHPTCHLELHEDRAYAHLHGLVARPVGDRRRLLELSDLEQVAEPLAALLLELPQRELGGLLPAWDDLVAQTAWARERGVPLQLDGARLWEAATGYGRTPAEVAALFDTVYVSFYKGLGGIAGACLAGPEDVIAEARVWRHRHGGTLFALWPYAAAALHALRTRLPQLPLHLERAREIAAALDGVDGVQVVPTVPDVAMMHLHLRTTDEHVRRTAAALATGSGLAVPSRSAASGVPGWRVLELSVGPATLDVPLDEVRAAVLALVAGQAGAG